MKLRVENWSEEVYCRREFRFVCAVLLMVLLVAITKPLLVTTSFKLFSIGAPVKFAFIDSRLEKYRGEAIYLGASYSWNAFSPVVYKTEVSKDLTGYATLPDDAINLAYNSTGLNLILRILKLAHQKGTPGLIFFSPPSWESRKGDFHRLTYFIYPDWRVLLGDLAGLKLADQFRGFIYLYYGTLSRFFSDIFTRDHGVGHIRFSQKIDDGLSGHNAVSISPGDTYSVDWDTRVLVLKETRSCDSAYNGFDSALMVTLGTELANANRVVIVREPYFTDRRTRWKEWVCNPGISNDFLMISVDHIASFANRSNSEILGLFSTGNHLNEVGASLYTRSIIRYLNANKVTH